ncbi:hypothetical protein [uncultured Sulfitobacter sp.]|uniref:hypothetical protein n=1 Tax=uncultured Sulfitobacter sp. TaxID=191468 RepID=UPI0025941AED|nr:hypothetical protein [uncultured Sulfitobacter sp.]
MSENMSQEQFNTIISRLDAADARLKNVEGNMVRKSDVFQSVLTVQGFTFAVIVGLIVILNAFGMFAN